MKYLTAACFVGTVYAANWMLTHYGIWKVGAFLVPSGVIFAGLGFLLRCCLQELASRVWVLGCILAGAVLSLWLGASAHVPGGATSIAVASAAAFTLAEFCDWAIYSPLRRRTLTGGLTAAQIVGAVVDSFVFLTLAFGSSALFGPGNLFLGQVIAKTLVVLPAVILVAAYRAGPRVKTA